MKIISRDLNPPESSAGGCFPLLLAALVPIGRSTDAPDAKSYAVLSLPPFSLLLQSSVLPFFIPLLLALCLFRILRLVA
jgi:hypothetical protein